VASMKDWGHDASLWAHCFKNYLAIWCSFFANHHHASIVGMLLFLRRITDLARVYKWQDCVLQLALDKHTMVMDKGVLSANADDWLLGPALEGSYLRPDNILAAKPSTSTTPRPARPTAPNNDSVVCERFNTATGCAWRACVRRHVCSKCGNDHAAVNCKVKK
jgi:hypothetical protein